MTNLTTGTVRHLDAINYVQAHLDWDPVTAAAITALYPSREQLRDLLASVAVTCAYLTHAADDGPALLARLRDFWLDGEAR
jgi:hypothetical protein